MIIDGRHQVKASRVARDLSLRRLEERFREPFPGRDEELARREQSRDVAQLKTAVEEVERITAMEKSSRSVDQQLSILRRWHDHLESQIGRVRQAEERLFQALGRVYIDPEQARARIEAAAAEIGAKQVGAALEAEPERFGALRTVERPRAFGLLIGHDDTQARQATPRAAFLWRERVEVETAVATVAHAEVPGEPTERALPWAELAFLDEEHELDQRVELSLVHNCVAGVAI